MANSPKKVEPHQVNWTHCHAMLLFNENQAKEHTVEIEMAEGHEDKLFTILGFGYVDCGSMIFSQRDHANREGSICTC
ncbi:hypothetical protein M3231_01450 [Neobacillus mesonae]|nr:hypothetical protein [Neobacillus mesonae]